MNSEQNIIELDLENNKHEKFHSFNSLFIISFFKYSYFVAFSIIFLSIISLNCGGVVEKEVEDGIANESQNIVALVIWTQPYKSIINNWHQIILDHL